MAIEFVSCASWALGTNGGTTGSSMDTTGATTLIAVTGIYGASNPTGTLEDSEENTWSMVVNDDPGGTAYPANIWYTTGTLATSLTHTFTFSQASSYSSLVVAGFTGLHATPLDVYNDDSSADGTATTVQAGEVTPSQDGSVLIAGLCYNASNDPSIDLSFVEPTNGTLNYGSTMGTSLAYLILPTAAAKNPTWTVGTATYLGAQIAVFKPAAGAAPTFTPRIIMIS